jgi:plasmid maintenance system antidote protein VapI
MDAIAEIQKEVDRATGLRALARELEISPSYLSQVMNGKSRITRSFADKLQEKCGTNVLVLLQWQATEDRKKYQGRKPV